MNFIAEGVDRGVATGGISVFIPPTPQKKSAQVNFLWGKNDVRMAIQQFYTPKKLLYPQKHISGYAPGGRPPSQVCMFKFRMP